MTKYETTETVIVKVGFLGSVSEAMGTGSFTVDSEMNSVEMIQIMAEAFYTALREAHRASMPIFSEHLAIKFTQMYGEDQ